MVIQLEPEGTEQQAEKLFVWMCSHLHALETVMCGTCWPLLTTSDADSVAGRVRVMEGTCECWMYTSVVHAWRFPEIPANLESKHLWGSFILTVLVKLCLGTWLLNSTGWL